MSSPQCRECGKTPDDFLANVARSWINRSHSMDLCPRCLATFLNETKCASCGRSPRSFTRKLMVSWINRDYAKTLCPRCVKSFIAAPKLARRPKCAGCGRAGKLQANVCKQCRDLGVSAPSLFGSEVR